MPKQLKLIHLVILLCLAVFAFSTRSIASQKDGLLKIHFFDIGQGDAIFIEAPNGNQALIDGGSGRVVLQKLGGVMPFYDRDIDLVVMTHPDADHASGLVEVLARYDVAEIVYSHIVNDSALYASWLKAVADEGANITDPAAGDVIDLGNEVFLRIVSPLSSVAGQTVKKTNDNSTVAMLDYKDLEVLLTGDIELKSERGILLEGIDADADILKVGHHGSKTSTGKEFLSAVSPDVAIIQVGAENRYGHPAPEVLERLNKYGIKVYRNDLDGDIRLKSDGRQFLISNP